ncbi:putative efflux protein, MATE family [Dethiosulfatibacter aminovorans DSM 17477]|uniref:Multidrug export protein MepA n=1 Tax=Dethiosulfatibacter aminovorans DSM 17477 TaxID=1121476 RepID=A0A1M6IIX0_9FIRM|nr:MATE family efflux transporter [Dethiosulfatibacter aminovorans]SHJ34358.1 putative efflux protein, MATE family [Dethiosulfatibacter aminovorans DSM 17477]
MNDKRIDILRNHKISSAINAMALPAIVGFLVMGIYNFVDTVFVAWLGTEATSATQVMMPIMMLVSSFGLAFGIGGASYISRLLGMNNSKEANVVASVALYTSVAVGILFAVTGIGFLEPILEFFGADESIMEMSMGYGRFIIMGSMFTMGNMAMNNLLRAEGSAKLSMLGMLAGSVLNIVLDPLFIFTFDMGIEGAAIATTLSQGVNFAILLGWYISKRTVIRISLKNYRPSMRIWGEISKVGIPTFFRQMLFSISLGLLNQGAMDFGGPVLLAAVGLIYKVALIPVYVVFGFGQGFQPVVGYNFGAGSKTRVLESISYTIRVSLGVSAVSAALIVFFGENILMIFKADKDVLEYALLGLKYNALAMVMMAVSNTISIFYQALGRGKESLVLSIARQGIFFIPSVVVLPRIFGETGILLAQLSADTLSLALSLAMILSYNRKKLLDSDILKCA